MLVHPRVTSLLHEFFRSPCKSAGIHLYFRVGILTVRGKGLTLDHKTVTSLKLESRGFDMQSNVLMYTTGSLPFPNYRTQK